MASTTAPANMGVRSKIASFEATQQPEKRIVSPNVSPSNAAGTGGAVTPDRPTPPTMLASQNRIHRLQRQAASTKPQPPQALSYLRTTMRQQPPPPHQYYPQTQPPRNSTTTSKSSYASQQQQQQANHFRAMPHPSHQQQPPPSYYGHPHPQQQQQMRMIYSQPSVHPQQQQMYPVYPKGGGAMHAQYRLPRQQPPMMMPSTNDPNSVQPYINQQPIQSQLQSQQRAHTYTMQPARGGAPLLSSRRDKIMQERAQRTKQLYRQQQLQQQQQQASSHMTMTDELTSLQSSPSIPTRVTPDDVSPHRVAEPHPYYHRMARLNPSSSSDYDAELRGNSFEEQQLRLLRHPTQSGLSATVEGGSALLFQQQQNRIDEEDDDDHLNDDVSLSYDQRRQQEETEARKTAANAAKANQEIDFEEYLKNAKIPVGRGIAFATVAAVTGCVILGPGVLLVGAAAVGIGAGAMQIPREQRTHILQRAQDSAVQAGDAISHSCVNTYKESGLAEHVEMERCCPSTMEPEMDEIKTTVSDNIVVAETYNESNVHAKKETPMPTVSSPSPLNGGRSKKGKVACLREGRSVPVAQIHSLNPSLQPKAWLDVLASAETSHDERIEAMEEVIILAKDKQRARIFVEEGILDSLMWMIGRYLEKSKHSKAEETNWAYPEISRGERHAVKLAAICCLTLGKSYCAAMHTDGDLQLMSLYDHGTVPEERQLAQMLLEVPHHVRVTKTDDPTIVDPNKEVFALRSMTLPQAEDLAASIKMLSESKI